MQLRLMKLRLLLTSLRWELLTWSVVAMLFIFAVVLQDQMYSDGDPSWGMQAALRMLHGGNYLQDFFDVNAPMSFYIYLLPAWFAASFKLESITVVCTYTFILAASSLAICYGLLQRILGKDAPATLAVLQITIAFIFLLLPASGFAEREHILLFLTFPYFLLVSVRIYNQAINTSYTLLLGLLAGIGFAIKPFFLFSLVFVEIYLAVHKKTCKVWLRPEALMIMLVMIGYLASVFILFPEYLFQVIPLVIHIYYPYIAVTYAELFTLPLTLLMGFLLGVLIILPKQLKWRPLVLISFLATFGFWLAFLSQRTLWYYHGIPYLALVIFTLLLITCAIVRHMITMQQPSAKYKIYLVIIGVMLVLAYPLTVNERVVMEAVYFRHNAENKQIIATIRQLAKGKPIYYFTVNGLYPLADYAGVYSASRFSDLWMSAVLYGNSISKNPLATNLDKEKKFFHTAVIEDLLRDQPYLILVDLSKKQQLPTHYNFSIYQPQFIQLLLHDKRFSRLWKNYVYIGTVANNAIYYYNLQRFPHEFAVSI